MSHSIMKRDFLSSLRRILKQLILAVMIGLSNALNSEQKSVNDQDNKSKKELRS